MELLRAIYWFVGLAVAASAASAQSYRQGEIVTSDDGAVAITVVNPVCVNDPNEAASAGCFFPLKALDVAGEASGSRYSLSELRKHNPGIETFLENGVLPPWHMVATRANSFAQLSE